jgi:hypothetical protein
LRTAFVRFDDASADRQSHAEAFGFGTAGAIQSIGFVVEITFDFGAVATFSASL